MTHDNVTDYIAVQCSSDPCAGCGNCDGYNKVINTDVCDQCQQCYGMAVRWIIRNYGWSLPIEWASAKACLDAFANNHERHFAVAEFYAALMRAVPLFAGCNFSAFARYMQALLLHAREISGGFFLSGDWERARRCTNWCVHTATADCSKLCNSVMREVSSLRRHGNATLALAGGVLSAFSARSRTARADASTVVRDILSIDPVAYAICECRRLRDAYGVTVRLDSLVVDYSVDSCISKYYRSGCSATALKILNKDNAPDQGAIPSTSRGARQNTPATSQAAE